MSETKRVTTITKGVKFIPGRRYMVNTETGVTYPYQAQMIKNPNMCEIYPKFPEIKSVPVSEPVKEAEVVEPVIPEVESIETEEPLIIEDIIVPPEPEPVADPEPEKLEPWQIAQAAKKAKAGKKEG